MKAYFLNTAGGAVVILTSYDFIKHPVLMNKLEDRGIKKFIAYELPLKLVKERYGTHFDIVRNDPEQTDELRVLEYDGERAYSMFSFDELGHPVYHESESRS